MKPTISQAIVNQFTGIYKGIGLLGIASFTALLLPLFSGSDIWFFSVAASAIIVILAAIGYFYSAVIDFEIIQEYTDKSNKKKPSWRDDEFLLHIHHKAMDVTGIVVIGLLFILWQIVSIDISINTLFTTRQFCGLTGGVFMSMYSGLVWLFLRDDK